jgi:SAM-dependent methyltransferase
MVTDGRTAAEFLDGAIARVCGPDGADRGAIRVLDFGCGAGALIGRMQECGYDAYGCDIRGPWTLEPVVAADRIRFVTIEPYRLPYDDDTFDVVFSTSVFEHALNKDECLAEIHRILKPGGYSMHILPSKWYMPWEPHIYVPFANFMWPNVPMWWLNLWAFLGVRNWLQTRMTWREAAEWNRDYCRRGLSYWTLKELRQTSQQVFGNFELPMQYFIEHSEGRASALCRKLPFRSFTSWLVGHLRMMFIVSRKGADPVKI